MPIVLRTFSQPLHGENEQGGGVPGVVGAAMMPSFHRQAEFFHGGVERNFRIQT